MCRVRHDDKLVYTLINQLNHFIQWAKEVYYGHCQRSSWFFELSCEFGAEFFHTKEPGSSVIWKPFLDKSAPVLNYGFLGLLVSPHGGLR